MLEPDAREEDLFIQSNDMALMNIAALHESGSLDLSPRFQRRNRWDRERQSQLIESFMLNVPVPPVYLAEEARGVFAVIDGKQRLTAIVQYLNGDFPLKNPQLKWDLEGKYFGELDNRWASTLKMRPLRTVTVMHRTADWVKHEVFLRLNRGGQPLNAQEVRNVAFAGPLNDEIIRLAEDRFLRRQLKITSDDSPAYANMSDVETVLRFFAVSDQWTRFGGSLSRAMDHFMLERHEAEPSEIRALSERFIRALRYCEAIWGQYAFQRFDGSQWRSQMIGGVYDAEMVAVNLTSDEVLDRVAQDPAEAQRKTADLFADSEFDAAVRLGTNTPARVQYRISRVARLLEALA